MLTDGTQRSEECFDRVHTLVDFMLGSKEVADLVCALKEKIATAKRNEIGEHEIRKSVEEVLSVVQDVVFLESLK